MNTPAGRQEGSVVPQGRQPDKKQNKINHFVEEVGLCFESAGLPRMAGRILGQLLVCIPPQLSAGELSQAVGGSKGSISTNIRMLLQSGLVERLAFPGERRTYFRIRPDAWAEHLRNQLERTTYLRQMAERGLALLADADPADRRRLEEMHAIHSFFEREAPALLERYERSHGGKRP